MKLNEFTEKLGSTSPTPGGGAASGLTLALAAACAEKAVRFSISDISEKICEQLIFLREEGNKLCIDDQNAFSHWQEMKKLPKVTETEKAHRTQQINNAAEQCAKVPLLTAEYSMKLLYTIDEFLPYCNKFLISDAACGVSLAAASFETSIFNIIINLPYIKNDIFKSQLETFITTNPDHFDVIKERILTECRKLLNA
ncbi:MAG: hypothetical protein A2015_11405 [Spirochaetes bacterium GWF1_31_7]|nr:MAG: hypothetical protein A2Y30_15670 [Spirochaetes bacterium GWE1_32_154]OHD49029.1 MAG: hypothetical protein A2015_11405 [Spirochaetes bacterium GWF1_31_7]OHD50387.1 MAG: hypothetical protein A2Y29_13720 [Spirochaetes bacterium GWE2_31_10]OHD75719.1 MAG: hypothetical protein A2355_00410 [Spirochaetes bacterium RIFOXYB1_FULL_32_8]HBD93824.1 hypothetical protein [Spirochaetia bacterium]